MSFNNPFKTPTPAPERPKTTTDSMRAMLARLDSTYGPEAVNEALSHLKPAEPTEEVTIRELTPAANQLLKEIDRIDSPGGSEDEITNAVATMQIERGI
ncbi:hypothetical protein BH11PAT2_BH11PAT2_00780 [soil metagenome]